MEFTALEHAAIKQFLSQPMEDMDILRVQFAAASVAKREYTGDGFCTTILVPRSLPPARESPALHRHFLTGAIALVKSDPDQLISFHLWTDAGYLASLEAAAMKGDCWPDESEMQVVPSVLRK
jgi:hypothetical protein